MTTQQPTIPTTAIDPATQVGLVSLTVADLARSVDFYTTVLGFAALARTDTTATLGAAEIPLLLLTEQPGAAPSPTHATGLYHFAILLPTRADLGRSLQRLIDVGYGLPGQGDHLVSEALYLEDLDGNGIEIYRDRPRDTWQRSNGQIRMATNPVDIRGLLTAAAAEGKPWSGLPAGTRIGHVHLKVGDIAQAAAFYHDVLGFDIVAQLPGALFVSAGGYHHHLGLNTWHSRGASPAPAGTAGLRFYSIELPSREALRDVLARVDAAGIARGERPDGATLQDPWQNTILLHVGPIAVPAEAASLALNPRGTIV
jgi:catechol 2,3-dioxygenase